CSASGDKREKGRGVRGLGLGRMPEVVVCVVVELLWGVEGFVGVERGLWSAISDCISERNSEIKQFRRASLDNPVDDPKRVSRARINYGHVLRSGLGCDLVNKVCGELNEVLNVGGVSGLGRSIVISFRRHENGK
nr:hypothetical protein [Tanacetum cinerariifolium]